MQFELAAFQRFAQIVEHAHAMTRQRVHLRIEQAHSVSARVFRCIQRGVRSLEQLIRTATVARRARHADAATQFDTHGVDKARLAQRVEQELRALNTLRVGKFARNNHRVFVAAQAREHFTVADQRAQAPRHLAQHLIAH